MIGPSARCEGLPIYAVGAIAERKRQLLREGVDVIDLGAGDADMAPPSLAVSALTEAAADPRNSRYAFQVGSTAFRGAVARYMERRFGVRVDPDEEVLPLIGSKEGIAHLPFAVLEPGDAVALPDPGYPAYQGGALLAGAEVVPVPLRPEREFLLDMEDVPAHRARRVGLVYLNYPNNPTAAVAPRDYLESVVARCRAEGTILAYDNPYAEITFDDYRAPSILEIPQAREVAVEFHSLSKTFGMTGWRLGWVVGNSKVVKALSKVKSYVDTGPFLAIQETGARILDAAEHLIAPIRREFQTRRDALVGALQEGGCLCPSPRATMYVWVPLERGVRSETFARRLLDEEGVAVLAGSALGQGGEGFVRLSFIAPPERLREAAARTARAMNPASIEDRA